MEIPKTTKGTLSWQVQRVMNFIATNTYNNNLNEQILTQNGSCAPLPYSALPEKFHRVIERFALEFHDTVPPHGIYAGLHGASVWCFRGFYLLNGTLLSYLVLRGVHVIYSTHVEGMELEIPRDEEETIETFSMTRSTVSQRSSQPNWETLDDHFDEAMEMFPPLDPDQFIGVQEDSSSYQPQGGKEKSRNKRRLRDSYTLNPNFKEIPEGELRDRIEKRLEFAARIKQEMNSITPAEIDLQAKLFDAKVAKARAEWELKKCSYQPHNGDPDSIDVWLSKLDALGDKLSTYSEVLSSKEVDGVIRHVERLIMLFIELRETRSYSGMMACILGYLQGFTSKSLFNTIREYLSDALAMEAQDGDEDSDTPAWLGIFRSITSDWRAVTKMPAWRYFQRVLSLSVAAGLCKAADVNFTIGEMKLFTIKIEEKQSSAFDLLDAILSTADYFVEAGYEAFKTKSIRPFFFDNQTARILDDAYVSISASMKALPTGDLDKTKYKTEAELAHVLENTLSGYVILRQQSKNPAEKRTLESRCMQLEEWKLAFIQTTVAGGLRESPYSVFLVGDPGIGKSMITQVLVEVVLQANGIKYQMKQVATVNPGDKFASTVKNDTIVIILDDFGNFVLDFETENPLKYIIEICNNVVSYVPKAEAQEKGKIAWRPKMVVTTSNMDNLLFNKLSNAPASAKRRGIRMKPKLKSEYSEYGRFSEEKYRERNDGQLPAVPDAYNIDIQEWGVKKWEYFQFNGKDTKDLSYAEALEFHIARSRKHFKEQKDYVKNHGSIREQIHVCEHGRVASECTKCFEVQAEQDLNDADLSHAAFEDACARALGMEAHFGTETLLNWFWRWLVGRILSCFSPLFVGFRHWLRHSTNEQLQELNSRLHFYSLFGIYDWLPDFVVNSSYFENYLLFVNSFSIAMRYWQLGLSFLLSWFLFLLGPSIGGILNICCIWPYLFQCATVTHVRIIEEFRNRREALPLEFTRSRDKFLKYALAGAFMLTGLVAAYKLYSSSKMMTPHGTLSPSNYEDIRKRDAEVSDWAQVEVEELPASDKSKCITHENLMKKVKKNQVYINYPDCNGTIRFTNGFFINSNELLLPYHVLGKDTRRYTIYRRGEQIRGGQFNELFSLNDVSVHPTKDLALVQCCNTAPFEDLRPYLALDVHKETPFSLHYMNKDDSYLHYKGVAAHGVINNSIRISGGYHYSLLDGTTFPGMCMATMISETRAPQIIGFHIGGKSGTAKGCGVAITHEEIVKMREAYYKKHAAALEMASEGTVYTEHFGVEWFEGPFMHDKSPIHYLPDPCNIRYFGSCIGRAKYYSEVVTTPIAEKVKEVCGNEDEFAGPDFHRWRSWYESLVHSCQPAIGCESAELDWAFTDLYNQIRTILDIPGVKEEIRPLTEIEIVSGIDGKRIMNQMVSNSAIGYPLTGNKRSRMIKLPPNDQHNCPRTFTKEIWDEYDKFEKACLENKMTYPMFKACLKDEPTPKGKKKVRVFQAAPLVLQIAVRKYFLPFARVLSLCPLKSECAVGINAHGPEWDELQEHVKRFGHERIVAGDYSKYDLRMSAKFTSAAWRLFIKLAEDMNWSEDHLTIMRAVATQIIYAMIAYNGDVYQLQGGNPSGQNLTVYINSIVNSLLNRVAFRKMYPDYKGTFEQVVALTTYGDDFKSSVSETMADFNHCTLAEKLASIDMKITMPDKTAEPIPFLSDENCDFLKRHNRLHEVGYYIGALDEKSIFKSLKAVVRSKHCSLKQQSAQNIDGALREWFFHGREVYEKRRKEMQQVAEESEIAHMCSMLDQTFDDRVRSWKEKYTPLEIDEDFETVDDSEEEAFEPHSGVEFVHDFCIGFAFHFCYFAALYLGFGIIDDYVKIRNVVRKWQAVYDLKMTRTVYGALRDHPEQIERIRAAVEGITLPPLDEYEAQSGVEHEMCNFNNCTYPDPSLGECVHVNCAPTIDVVLMQCAFMKLYLLPVVLYLFYLIFMGRIRPEFRRLTYTQIFVLYCVYYLEGWRPWYEQIYPYLLFALLGRFLRAVYKQ